MCRAREEAFFSAFLRPFRTSSSMQQTGLLVLLTWLVHLQAVDYSSPTELAALAADGVSDAHVGGLYYDGATLLTCVGVASAASAASAANAVGG